MNQLVTSPDGGQTLESDDVITRLDAVIAKSGFRSDFVEINHRLVIDNKYTRDQLI